MAARDFFGSGWSAGSGVAAIKFSVDSGSMADSPYEYRVRQTGLILRKHLRERRAAFGVDHDRVFVPSLSPRAVKAEPAAHGAGPVTNPCPTPT